MHITRTQSILSISLSWWFICRFIESLLCQNTWILEEHESVQGVGYPINLCRPWEKRISKTCPCCPRTSTKHCTYVTRWRPPIKALFALSLCSCGNHDPRIVATLSSPVAAITGRRTARVQRQSLLHYSTVTINHRNTNPLLQRTTNNSGIIAPHVIEAAAGVGFACASFEWQRAKLFCRVPVFLSRGPIADHPDNHRFVRLSRVSCRNTSLDDIGELCCKSSRSDFDTFKGFVSS